LSSAHPAHFPDNAAAEQLVCLAKDRTGLDESKIRVAIALGSGGYAVGSEVIVCLQYNLESISGLIEFVGITDQVTSMKSPMRIDNLNAALPLAVGQETPFRR